MIHGTTKKNIKIPEADIVTVVDTKGQGPGWSGGATVDVKVYHAGKKNPKKSFKSHTHFNITTAGYADAPKPNCLPTFLMDAPVLNPNVCADCPPSVLRCRLRCRTRRRGSRPQLARADAVLAFQLTTFCLVGVVRSPGALRTTVERRFKHFEWLHERLQTKYPCLCVPPIPDFKFLSKFGEDSQSKKTERLQRWVNRVMRHPVLSHDGYSLKHFIEVSPDN